MGLAQGAGRHLISPGQFAGRGLKPEALGELTHTDMHIARSIRRAWIETDECRGRSAGEADIARSIRRAWIETGSRPGWPCSWRDIARSIRRAWIETSWRSWIWAAPIISPGQFAGRGLKRHGGAPPRVQIWISPGQFAGRGLKQRYSWRGLLAGCDIARSIRRAWIETYSSAGHCIAQQGYRPVNSPGVD